jgi:hypothetical protein
MKAIILVEASTQEQTQDCLIEVQIDKLRKYSKRNNLKIIKEFSIVKSSIKGYYSKDFGEAIEFIKQQKQEIAFVANNVDIITLNDYSYVNNIFQSLRECHLVSNKKTSPAIKHFLSSGFDSLFVNEIKKIDKLYYIDNTPKRHEVEIVTHICEMLNNIDIYSYKSRNRIYFCKYDSYLIFRQIKEIYYKWSNEICEYNKQIKEDLENKLINKDPRHIAEMLIPWQKDFYRYCMELRSAKRRKFIRLFLDLYKNELTQ